MSSIILLTFLLSWGILILCQIIRWLCRNDSKNSKAPARKNKIDYLHKATQFIYHVYQVMTDMVIVDVAFACFYNLVTDYKTSYPMVHYIGKTLSSIFISIMVLNYLYVLDIASCKPWKMGIYQSRMVLENLNKTVARSSVLVRSINIVFRIKIILLMGCLIML